MARDYSSYTNVKEDCVQLFERSWHEVVVKLPIIKTNIQNDDNIKAAVFNVWLNYSDSNEHLFLKADRMFLHAYDERLINRINKFLWKNRLLEELFKKNEQNQQFIFKFSYFLTAELFNYLDSFIQQHTVLKDKDLRQYPYYYWSDDDLEQNNEIYVLMKYLNAEFINEFLTEGRVKSMSIRLYKMLLNEGYTSK